jgi:hypothetical protein
MNILTMEGLKQTIDRVISGMDMDGKSIIKIECSEYHRAEAEEILEYEGCQIEISDELVDKQVSVTTYADNMTYTPPRNERYNKLP